MKPSSSNSRGLPTGANLDGSTRSTANPTREKHEPTKGKLTGSGTAAAVDAETKPTAPRGKRPVPDRQSEPPGTNRDVGAEPKKRDATVRTHLTDRQLEEFKELLLAKRAQLTGDVQGLANEARGRSAQGESEHSNMPIHMADLGSDTWEQDFTLGLIANAEGVVREIDDALARIEDRTYGICLAGNDRITVARLRAKPWAKYCVEHARLVEEGRLR